MEATKRDIQKNKKTVDLLALGFSTLFLNRTNISGIISGGVIGGLKQNGPYKINCRFNKNEIISRIQKISSKKRQIKLYNKDALKLIEITKNESSQKRTIFYFDPPYFIKGSSLYLNHYKKEDHIEVSNMIKGINNAHWIVSYDNVEEIRNLYAGFKKKEYSLKYTAHQSKIGDEILFFSNGLSISNISKKYSPINFRMINSSKIICKGIE